MRNSAPPLITAGLCENNNKWASSASRGPALPLARFAPTDGPFARPSSRERSMVLVLKASSATASPAFLTWSGKTRSRPPPAPRPLGATAAAGRRDAGPADSTTSKIRVPLTPRHLHGRPTDEPRALPENAGGRCGCEGLADSTAPPSRACPGGPTGLPGLTVTARRRPREPRHPP
jgi:hypothetical protein